METYQQDSILDYVDYLTPNSDERGKYECPLCFGHNLSIKADGKFKCYGGKDSQKICEPKDIYIAAKKLAGKWEDVEDKPAPRRIPTPLPAQKPIPSNASILKSEPREAQILAETFGSLTELQKKYSLPFKLNEIPSEKPVTLKIWEYGEQQRVFRFEWPDAEKPKGYKKTIRQGYIENGKVKSGVLTSGIEAYRLPEVLSMGNDSPQFVLIPEGEPCADAGWRVGLPSVTLLGSQWGEVSIEAMVKRLHDCNLIPLVLQDDDGAGAKKAKKIEDVCRRLGVPFVIINNSKIAEGDLADWVSAGASEEYLRDTIQGLIPKNQITLPDVNGVDADNPPLNIPAIMAKVFQLSKVAGHRLKFNDFTNDIELDGERISFNGLKILIAEQFNLEFKCSQQDLQDIVERVAKDNRYNPVRDYLLGCKLSPGILDNLASKIFGTDQEIFNVYLRKFLISAVARIMEPGCKVDTALILQGKQGIGKSTFFSALMAERKWFCDDMMDIGNKDEILKLHQHWIIEWGELEHQFGKKGNSIIKAFISRSEDNVRPPYGRTMEKLPRHSVLTGTTNEDDFLTDPTGDRRFWIIPVKFIDLEYLRSNRNQIWGAALEAYQAGEQWWLDANQEQARIKVNQSFQKSSSIDDDIDHLIEGMDKVNRKWLLHKLAMVAGRTENVKELERDMAYYFKRAGWDKVERTLPNPLEPGKRSGGWVKPDDLLRARNSRNKSVTDLNPNGEEVSSGFVTLLPSNIGGNYFIDGGEQASPPLDEINKNQLETKNERNSVTKCLQSNECLASSPVTGVLPVLPTGNNLEDPWTTYPSGKSPATPGHINLVDELKELINSGTPLESIPGTQEQKEWLSSHWDILKPDDSEVPF